jgi:DNA-directed RNA polymerase specialized sigma24 family protein
MADDGAVTFLIEGVKTGDEGATRKLWDRYFQRLVRLAARRLPQHSRRDADEEDVALSAFHSFCARAARDQFPALSGRDDLWRLLAAITTRKAAGLFRRRSRLKRGGGVVVGESALLDGLGGDGEGMARLLGRTPGPEIAAQMAEDFERLMEALGDETLRRIARMKMEGHSTGEVAERLGVTTRTVDRKLQLIRAIWEAHAAVEA